MKKKILYGLLLSLTMLFFQQCKSAGKTFSSNSKNAAEVKLRTAMIKEAEKYKGTKYKYGGKNPKGFDCSGFTYYVCSKFDIQLMGSSSYQSKQGIEVPISKVKSGDLLFFGRYGKSGKIQHVGMVYKNTSEGLYMIHSSSKRGIVIDNISTFKYWKSRLLFARQIIQLKK